MNNKIATSMYYQQLNLKIQLKNLKKPKKQNETES